MKRHTSHRGDAEAASKDEHNDDELVELTSVASIAEATAIKQNLERTGIRACVFESDAGGWAPYLSVFTGQRVMVCAKDKAQAELLLSSTGGLLPLDEPTDEPTQPPTVTKHLRHHEEL